MEFAHTIKCMTMGMPALLFGGTPGYRAGDERLAYEKFPAAEAIHVMSKTFVEGGEIPLICSQDGANLSPAVEWTGVPDGTVSLTLIVEDPDVLRHPIHLCIGSFSQSLAGDVRGCQKGVGTTAHDGHREVHDGPGTPGKNSKMHVGYIGAAPPKGDRPHRYFFQVFALNRLLDLPGGAGRGTILAAMSGHVLAKGQMIGTYKR